MKAVRRRFRVLKAAATHIRVARADRYNASRRFRTMTEPARFDDPNPRRRIGVSFRASYARRVKSGFMTRYFSGASILDIGFRGGDPQAVPITENAIGVELDYPGYDGVTLPFADGSQDTVLAAHVLEHIPDFRQALRDWLRVLKIGGFLVIMIPHRDLYERQPDLPSRWNGDHKRHYTPASLMGEVEDALPVSSYRVRHLADNDEGFDYARGPDQPPVGGYEIELVLQKIARPAWADRLRYPPAVQAAIDRIDGLVVEAVRGNLASEGAGARRLAAMIPELAYFPPWSRLRQAMLDVGEAELRKATRPVLELARFDVDAYAAAYADLRGAQAAGKLPDLRGHWLGVGYFEGRVGRRFDPFSAEAL
jgi:SAM-dependent methyltransferase